MFGFNDIMGFFFKQKGELYFVLKKILGFKPKNIKLYWLALVHKSVFIKDENGVVISNERLEFLGDAIIEAVVSDILYRKFDGNEGFLTTTRSKLVQRKTLNRVAEQIGLSSLIMCANKTKRSHNSYIEGNAFEALIGAIYLDRGYKYCQRFMQTLIDEEFLNPTEEAEEEQNFKSRLLEWGQRNRLIVSFLSYQLVLPPSSKKAPFLCKICIEGHIVSEGIGFSKKESHQKAAEIAYNKFCNPVDHSEEFGNDYLFRKVITDNLAK